MLGQRATFRSNPQVNGAMGPGPQGVTPRRWWVILLAAAIAVPAAVLAQDPEQEYKPVKETVCWQCHFQISMKDYPALKNFFAIIPPEQAGAPPGVPFAYTFQVQNTWGAELLFIQPTMDLTNASSVAFVSDLPDINNATLGAIAVDRAALDQPQSDDQVIEVPFGYSKGRIDLTPGDRSPVTGPSMTMKIWYGNATGEPLWTSAPGTRGANVTYDIASREDIERIGYGNWTVRAETRFVPANGTEVTLPPTSANGEIAYTLALDLHAEAILDRILSLPSRELVAPGQARTVTYSLIGLNEPAEGETVRLWVDAWIHYNHESDANPDHENTTREFDPPIEVQPGVSLVATIDPATTVFIPSVHNGATITTISEVVGYAAAMLLISSVWTGGMFGKASRRQLNTVFGSAKRRVAFHNFLSYGILLASAVHTVLFIIEAAFYWTVGIIWGGIAILAMIGLGVTGALQVQMIRRWNYAFWRWSHYGLAVAAILFSVVHGLLDGVHFDAVQDRVGWTDPLDPRDITASIRLFLFG